MVRNERNCALTDGYASSNSRIFRALGKLSACFISRHIRTLTREPIVKLKAILSRKQTQAEVNQSYEVFVQKERRWIISSSLIRIGIIAHDSSLLGLRFTGFGNSFLDFMVNVECQRTASTTSILSMQVPENAIQMAC